MRYFNKSAPHSAAEVQEIIKQTKALIRRIDQFLDAAKKQRDQSQNADSQ